jgi:hypothetical protein
LFLATQGTNSRQHAKADLTGLHSSADADT